MKSGKAKIQFALVTVAAISLGTSLLSLSFLNSMAKKIEQIAYEDAHLAELGESIALNILKARREEKNFIIYQDTSYIQESKYIIQQIRNRIESAPRISNLYAARFDTISILLPEYEDRLSQLVTHLQENPRTLLRLQQQLAEYDKRLNSLAEEAGDDRKPSSLVAELIDPLFYASTELSTGQSKLFNELKTISGSMIAISEQISSDARNRLIQHSREGLNYAVRAQRNTVTLLLITALLLVFLIFYLPFRIFQPHKKLIRMLRTIARGNTEMDMSETHTDDELGELSRSFESALAELQKLNQLKTAKIAADKRNLYRITDEVEAAVIIATPDLTISHMNDAARELFSKGGKEKQGTVQEITLLWSLLKDTIEDIHKKGRTELTFSSAADSLKGKNAVIIPSLNRLGKPENIIIIIRL